MQFNEYNHTPQVYLVQARKKYGFMSFVFDCIMTFVTGGFWLLWVFVREMRRR
jgi:hypothetical protein